MRDAREAGFAEVQVQDPFTNDGQLTGMVTKWILVLTPAAAQPAPGRKNRRVEITRPSALRRKSSSALPSSDVLVLDVRDPENLPAGSPAWRPARDTRGAVEAGGGDPLLASEKRRIVTYCS